MKTINWILTCTLVAMVTISCTQDNEQTSESASLTTDITNLKNQIPNPLLDETTEGIYHGIVASASTQSRGKIWVNVANNSNFNALIELVDGGSIEFNLDPDTVEETATMTIFEFASTQGSFTLDLSNPDEPVISDIALMSETYFGRVVRSMGNNMASSATATFTENGNPAFSGTWNLIADGTNASPNGENGDGITSLLITYNLNVYEDFEFDNFNAMGCLGISSYVPTLGSFETTDYTVCDYQTTSFAGGTAKWYLSFDPTGSGYMNYLMCETTVAGTFTWTSDDGTIYREGEIMLD